MLAPLAREKATEWSSLCLSLESMKRVHPFWLYGDCLHFGDRDCGKKPVFRNWGYSGCLGFLLFSSYLWPGKGDKNHFLTHRGASAFTGYKVSFIRLLSLLMGTNQLVNIRAKLVSTPVLSWYEDLFAAFHIHRLSSLNTKYYINNWLPWKQIGPSAVCSVLIFLTETPKE